MRPFLAAFTLLLTLGIAAAQDESPPAPAPAGANELAAALTKLAGAETVFAGSVRLARSGDDAMAGMMMLGGPGAAAKPFEGGIEAVRLANGGAFIASAKACPGFAILEEKGERFTQMLFGKKLPGLGPLENDMKHLLDLAGLAEKAKKAKWKAERDDAGVTTLKGRIPSKPFRGDVDPMRDMMRPKVIEVKAVFELDAAGRLLGMTFEVIRSDPMAAMQELAMESGGELQIGPDMDLDDIEGQVIVYSMNPAAKPSKRTAGALADIRRLTSKD